MKGSFFERFGSSIAKKPRRGAKLGFMAAYFP
jgi:hypothetical protein